MSAETTSETHIPPVSWDDLLSFHARHYPNVRAPASLLSQQHTSVATVSVEEDDHLGYYDDGVKRTLTDDQIAMFRHSEIQTLLRERRHRQEAADEEFDDNRVDIAPETPLGPSEASPKSPIKQPSDEGPKRYRKAKKRKKMENKPWTSRRHAREQDEVMQDHVELEY